MAQDRVIGVVYNDRVPEAVALTQELSRRYGSAEGSWSCSAAEVETVAQRMPSTHVVITVGGDGTILQAVRVTAPCAVPILGVNLGRVGFMTELRADEALEGIAEYLVNGQEWVEERTMLQATGVPEGTLEETGEGQAPAEHPGSPPFQALNDVVVGRGAVTRMVHVVARINGHPLPTYYADGVVVATATGSTGYTLSVGGPIVYPQSQDLLLTPVAPHLSLSRTLVLSPSSVVDLTVHTSHQAVLSVDGGLDLPLADGDAVRIQRSPHRARFLRARPSTYFYHALTHRLGLDRGLGNTRLPEGSD